MSKADAQRFINAAAGAASNARSAVQQTAPPSKSSVKSEVRRRLAAVEHGLKPTGPLEDTEQFGYTSWATPTRQLVVYAGVVKHAVPGIYAYWVALDGLNGDILCCYGGGAASTLLSTRSHTTLTPGSRVIVAYDKLYRPYGVIMAVEPDITDDGGLNYSPAVSAGSAIGAKREAIHRPYVDGSSLSRGVLNWLANRPLDTTSLGDVGYSTTTGGIFSMDPFMMLFRQSDMCGLSLYYFDQLARLAALNYDFRSSGQEIMIRNDQGEIFHYTGSAPYAWNLYGYGKYNSVALDTKSFDEVHFLEAVGAKEPFDETARPFHTYEEFRGYLGQGYMRQVSVPLTSGVNTLEDPIERFGVFREQIGMEGSYVLASAHSIRFVKRPLLPVPSWEHLPDDPTGDHDDGSTTSEYAFAGVFGSKSHKVTNMGSEEEAELTALHQIAWLRDSLAYDMQWKALHPFKYHDADFTVDETNGPFSSLMPQPLCNQLQSQQFLDLPPTNNVEVDHRYGEQTYSNSQAGFSLEPDGSVVFFDAYGSELRLSGGHIYLSCPGDIYAEAGRSVINVAGDDFIAKAYKSADITATKNDVRIKAEQNMDIVSGVAGVGRLLLENQSRGPATAADLDGTVGEDLTMNGLILKAENSTVASYGNNIYLRALSSGTITLDADQTSGSIILAGGDITGMAKDSLTFQVSPDGFEESIEPTCAFVVSRDWCIATASFSCLGGTRLNNTLLVQDSVYCMNGHIYTGLGMDKTDHIYVYPLAEGEDARKAFVGLFDDGQKENQSYAIRVSDLRRTNLTVIWDEEGIGSSNFVEKCQFSFRSEEQYGTTGYVVVQPAWMHALSTLGLESWEESTIQYQDEIELGPYPGPTVWSGSSSFLAKDSQDGEGPPDENQDYEELTNQANWPNFERAEPQSRYLVVTRS